MNTRNSENEEIDEEVETAAAALMAAMQETTQDAATIGLMGDIDEEGAQEVVLGLVHLNDGRVFPNPIGPDEEPEKDIDFLIFAQH